MVDEIENRSTYPIPHKDCCPPSHLHIHSHADILFLRVPKDDVVTRNHVPLMFTLELRDEVVQPLRFRVRQNEQGIDKMIRQVLP